MNQEIATQQIFPAKVLVFGEYGIISGGSGLAIPYPGFSGKLEIGSSPSSATRVIQSSHFVSLFTAYLRKQKYDFHFIDSERINDEVKSGIWFNSTIPIGYGLGSSGALVAAIYSAYRTDFSQDTTVIKSHLSQMESYFHGSSSGIDPTVSYYNKPLIANESFISIADNWSITQLGLSVFLIDTGESAKTINLVDWFKAKMTQTEFRHITGENYLKVNQSIIDQVQQGRTLSITDIQIISRYQLDYLSPMIPESFQKHFLAGLACGEFTFKLCGSGGGGFMLCFSKNASSSIRYFEKENLNYIHLGTNH